MSDIDYDALVRAFILRQFRAEPQSRYQPTEWTHLRDCADVQIAHPEAYNGQYGCDTGCEYARFEAIISCPHNTRGVPYVWGEFGDIGSCLRELDGMETWPP